MIAHLVVCEVGFRWDFSCICPTWHPTIPPKNTLTEEGYLLYVRQSTYKKRRYLSSKPHTTRNLGGNEEIPQWWDFAHNITVLYGTNHNKVAFRKKWARPKISYFIVLHMQEVITTIPIVSVHFSYKKYHNTGCYWAYRPSYTPY